MKGFFYFRKSENTMFVLPTIAVGIDAVDGLPFLEFAWLFWAVGVGAK